MTVIEERYQKNKRQVNIGGGSGGGISINVMAIQRRRNDVMKSK